MFRVSTLVSLLSLVIACGCGSSKDTPPRTAAGSPSARQQLLVEHGQYFQDVRQKLRTIAGKLPAQGSLPAKNAPIALSPTLTKTTGGTNYEVLLEKQLLDPEYRPKSDDHEELSFHLQARDHLLRSLRWTGPRKEEFLAEAPEQLDWNIKNALQVRYVVVVRAVKYEPTRMGATTRPVPGGFGAYFVPGAVEMEVFVADISTGELCGSFLVSSNFQTAKRTTSYTDSNQMAYEDVMATLKELTAEPAGK